MNNPILTANRKVSKHGWKVKTIEDHIRESVFPCPLTGCWHWAGTIDKSTGYGQFSMDHKTIRAHRAMFEYYNEVKLTPDQILCHKCDNRACVNPDHLFIGTQADNVADMVKKGRHSKGESSGQAKLTIPKVREIKQLIEQGETNEDIAAIYNVHRSAVYRIKVGDNWSWLNG